MGIPLLEGRDFTPTESRFGTDLVLIANRTLAQQYLGANPVGRRIQIGDAGKGPWLPVVGVVADTYVGSRSGGIGLRSEPVPQLYVSWGALAYSAATLVVRTHSENPEQQVPFVREVLAELAPTAPLQNAGGLSLAIQESTWAFTLFGAAFSVFGIVTVLMAAVGLFSMMAFAVRQRTREMGVRIALGARSTDILRLVTRTVAGQVAGGLVVGLGLSLLLSRSLQLVLFDVSATVPATSPSSSSSLNDSSMARRSARASTVLLFSLPFGRPGPPGWPSLNCPLPFRSLRPFFGFAAICLMAPYRGSLR